KNGKTYVGYTSNLINRLRSHNSLASDGFTFNHRPWIVIYVEFHTTKKDAMLRERYFKSGIGRTFIRNLVAKEKE
ncbi:MAG: GIY-YIG nuclease family protein, partial [Bacteroidota bacterium]